MFNSQDNLCGARELNPRLNYLCCSLQLQQCSPYSDPGRFSPNKPQHQTTVMFNFLFSQELVLSRELKSLLLQGPGSSPHASTNQPPISPDKRIFGGFFLGFFSWRNLS